MSGTECFSQGCAVFELPGRGLIRVTGEDRARLLHAMTTNHVQQLQPGEGCYAFFLNAQGKILADVTILALEDALLLDTEAATRERVYQHLDKFIIADDAVLEDVSGQLAVIALEGEAATVAAARLGWDAAGSAFSHASCGAGRVARISASGWPGVRVYCPAGERAQWLERAAGGGAVAVDPETVRIARLERFQPRFGEDIFDTTLAQETQQAHALHFNKGCYLGQEIVERVRSRALLHKLLCGLLIEGQVAFEPGQRVLSGETEAAKITSSAYSARLGATVALAYVRTPYSRPGTELSADGWKARVYAPNGSAGTGTAEGN